MTTFFRDQQGSTSIEYSTIAAMMGFALVLVIPNLAAIIGSKLSALSGFTSGATLL